MGPNVKVRYVVHDVEERYRATSKFWDLTGLAIVVIIDKRMDYLVCEPDMVWTAFFLLVFIRFPIAEEENQRIDWLSEHTRQLQMTSHGK